MLNWKDVTTYSRFDKDKKPTTWRVKLGRLSVSVVYGHIYYPKQWAMHCSPFFDTYLLNAETEEEAKAEALELLEAELDKVLADLFNGQQ